MSVLLKMLCSDLTLRSGASGGFASAAVGSDATWLKSGWLCLLTFSEVLSLSPCGTF